MKHVSEIIHDLTQQLLPEYGEIHQAQQSAWQLLELATNKNRAALIASSSIEITPEQQQKLDHWVHDIVHAHKPIQYILGSVPFLDLTINVRPPILIPRPETEEWVEKVIEEIKRASPGSFDTIPSHAPESLRLSGSTNSANHEKTKPDLKNIQTTAQPECFANVLMQQNVSKDPEKSPLKILDLCTGSGCIALALAQKFPHAQIVATDICSAALALAQENAILNNITNITFIQSDLYTALKGLTFDIIVVNPPYITPQAYQKLDPSVKNWEDRQALVAPQEGLEIIQRIANDAKKFISHEKSSIAQLWIEIGFDQADNVAKIVETAGFQATIIKDFAGHNRVITGKIL